MTVFRSSFSIAELTLTLTDCTEYDSSKEQGASSKEQAASNSMAYYDDDREGTGWAEQTSPAFITSPTTAYPSSGVASRASAAAASPYGGYYGNDGGGGGGVNSNGNNGGDSRFRSSGGGNYGSGYPSGGSTELNRASTEMFAGSAAAASLGPTSMGRSSTTAYDRYGSSGVARAPQFDDQSYDGSNYNGFHGGASMPQNMYGSASATGVDPDGGGGGGGGMSSSMSQQHAAQQQHQSVQQQPAAHSQHATAHMHIQQQHPQHTGPSGLVDGNPSTGGGGPGGGPSNAQPLTAAAAAASLGLLPPTGGGGGPHRLSRRPPMQMDSKPNYVESIPMPPINTVVEANLPRPKTSRRFVPYTKVSRQPDMVRAKPVKNARLKSNDDNTVHIVNCPNCRQFLKLPKSAVLMHCPTCSAVSPASSAIHESGVVGGGSTTQ